MGTLYTVVYPEIAAADAAFVEALRARHDAQSSVLIRAHFTLVFACNAVPLPDYVLHVDAVARATRSIHFRCRYAMPGTEDHAGICHAYLVPDEGFAALSLLHDHLHTGVLAEHLRPDLPFIPHITIATLHSHREARALCDTLNEQTVDIAGTLRALTVGFIESGAFVNHAALRLQAEEPE